MENRPNGATPLTAAQVAVMNVVGRELWDAMASMVDANPELADVDRSGRAETITHMCMQAVLQALIEVEGNTRVVKPFIRAAGRMLGLVIAQAPSPAQGEIAWAEVMKHAEYGATDHAEAQAMRGMH